MELQNFFLKTDICRCEVLKPLSEVFNFGRLCLEFATPAVNPAQSNKRHKPQHLLPFQ